MSCPTCGGNVLRDSVYDLPARCDTCSYTDPPGLGDESVDVSHEDLDDAYFGSWPRTISGTLVEPRTGAVLIKPRDRKAIELGPSAVRGLAVAAVGDDKTVLLEAAAEAERQQDTYADLMESRGMQMPARAA